MSEASINQPKDRTYLLYARMILKNAVDKSVKEKKKFGAKA